MSISSIGTSSAGIPSWQTQRPDPAKMASDLFSKLNTDGSGGISASELESALSSASDMSSADARSAATSIVRGLDSDGNGQISQDELTSGFKQLAQQFDDHFNASRITGMGQPPSAQQVFSGVGSDGSGGISQSELATALAGADAGASSASNTASAGTTAAGIAGVSGASALFKALDANGDGSVSQDELASAMQKLSSHGHHGMHRAESASGAYGSNGNAMSVGVGGAAATEGATGSASDTGSSDASGAQGSQNDMLKHMLMQLARFYGGTPAAAQSGSSIAVAA